MLFNFLKKFPFGLDISDYSIEALELERKFGKVFLGAYGRVKLEKEVVEDGKILDREKLKEKITEVLKNTLPKSIKTNKVILSLPESKTFFHIFQLPANLTAQELANAIEQEALKTIPLDPGSYYSDFQVVSKTNNLHPVRGQQALAETRKEQTSNGVQEVLYVGASKEIVGEYLKTVKEARLKPIALDIESASLVRAFENEMIKDGSSAPVLIADVGARTTKLTIVDKGSIGFSAISPMAGYHFTQVISEKLGISIEKAEELKRNYGLDPKKKEGKIMLILQSALQDILQEIKKSISFYEEKSGRNIKKILLCGGSSFIPHLSSYFASNFGIGTLVPDPWTGIDVEILFKKPRLRKIIETKLHPVYFATVIGLAKRGLEKDPETAGINLIPVEK